MCYRFSGVLNANTPHAREVSEGDGHCTLVQSTTATCCASRPQRPELALGGGRWSRNTWSIRAAQPGARPVHVGVARKISAGLGVANWHRPATAAEGDIFGSRNRADKPRRQRERPWSSANHRAPHLPRGGLRTGSARLLPTYDLVEEKKNQSGRTTTQSNQHIVTWLSPKKHLASERLEHGS